MKQYIDIEFTLDLNDEQQDFTLEYIDYAHRQRNVEAGFDVQRHGCGEVLLYITDVEEDERLTEVEFSPDETRNFTTEVGQYWHDKGRLGETEQNALHYIQLAAAYADGEITKEEVAEKQEDFEDSHDFVQTGLNSLQFRKNPNDTEDNQ